MHACDGQVRWIPQTNHGRDSPDRSDRSWEWSQVNTQTIAVTSYLLHAQLSGGVGGVLTV